MGDDGSTKYISDNTGTRPPSSEELWWFLLESIERGKMTSGELNSFHRNWKEYMIEWDSNGKRPPSAEELSKYLRDGELIIELTPEKKVLYFAGHEYLLNSNTLEKLANIDAYGSSEACKKNDESGEKLIFEYSPYGARMIYWAPNTSSRRAIYLKDSDYRKETGFCLESVFNLVKEVTS